MNSKDVGNIGEAIILSEFIKRNIPVAIPFGDNCRYDLIAEFNGKLNKIQVKYSSQVTKNNSVICHISSSTYHTNNKHEDKYVGEVDYIAIYVAPWEESILVPISECDKYTFTIRRIKCKNSQEKAIHLISDYLFDKILCVETLHDESSPGDEKD